MSFRRNAKKANFWRKRLANYPELLERANLPDVVIQDDRAWLFFLQEGCFQGDKNSRLIDAMSFLSDKQQEALYELLSNLLTEQERIGSALWMCLNSHFGKSRE